MQMPKTANVLCVCLAASFVTYYPASGEPALPVEFFSAGKTFVEVQSTQGYRFGIGKYEVTVSDYTDFLNAAAKADPHNLWSNKTQFIARAGTSGSYVYAAQPFMAQRPISYLTWFDAARYVNWLHNGGASGSTEAGVYALNGGESLITERSPQARFWIPSDEEWREAAYGTGDRNPANYWLYATQSDTLPLEVNVDAVGNGSANGGGNTANYNGDNGPDQLANIGTSGGPSFYGAYDMAGNISEIVDYPTPASPSLGWDFGFFTRGGDWANSGLSMAATELGGRRIGIGGLDTVGLRIATVPEPTTLWLAGIGVSAVALKILRRRRAV
jgi:sulfatase modifying factor 1